MSTATSDQPGSAVAEADPSTTQNAPAENQYDAVDPNYGQPPVDDLDDQPIDDAPVDDAAEETPVEDAAAPEAEAAEAPAEPEAAAVAETPEADEFDAEILARASRYEITPEEAKGFGSRANLEQTLRVIDAREVAAFKASMGGQEAQPAEQAAPPAQQPAAPAQVSAAQPTSAEVAEFEAIKAKLLDPEIFEPSAIEAISGLFDPIVTKLNRVEAENAQLREQQNQFTSRVQAEDAARFTRDMDTFCNSVPEELRELYGKGEIYDLPADSPQRANRIKLAQETMLREQIDRANGRPVSPIADRQARALAALHHDILKTTARNEVRAEVQKRNRQSLAKPTGRGPVKDGPRERAVARESAIADKIGSTRPKDTGGDYL
jgi:hypothetical protein